MVLFLLAVSAVVPSALLVWYFHARDVYPEPPRVLWTTFALGVLTVVPVLIVGYPVHDAVSLIPSPIAASFLGALFVAAIPEEFVKLAVLLGYNMRHKAFDEPMDGIVYGVVASLGFATLENVLFVFDGGLSVAVSRAFTAVPLHAFVGAIMGYYVGQGWFRPEQRWQLILRGYLAAVVLHALYDFPLMAMADVEDVALAGVLALCTLAVLIIGWRWTVRLVRRLRQDQLLAAMTRPADGEAVSATPADLPAPPVDLRQRFTGIAVALAGGLLASFGGMVTLGLTLAFLIGAVLPEHRLDVLVGGAVSGLLPLLVGVVVFRKGVDVMNGKT